MLVGYARVSSTGQSLEVQLDQLKAAGCEKVFAEKKSGMTTDGRDALAEAIDYVREGDTLIVTRLNSKGVSFRCLQQGAVDTTSSMGKLVLGILGAVAEFEADIRRERQKDGIEKVRQQHPERYRGRRPTVDAERIRELSAQGMGPSAIARETGYGRMTVYRALKPT
jgi:DNA invertase Pin-like site-specific DNA recombinase